MNDERLRELERAAAAGDLAAADRLERELARAGRPAASPARRALLAELCSALWVEKAARLHAKREAAKFGPETIYDAMIDQLFESNVFGQPRHVDRLGVRIDVMTASRLHEDRDYVLVALDEVGPISVSTVWLLSNHAYRDERLAIFETMTFVNGGAQALQEYNECCWGRYATEEEALEGHKGTRTRMERAFFARRFGLDPVETSRRAAEEVRMLHELRLNDGQALSDLFHPRRRPPPTGG